MVYEYTKLSILKPGGNYSLYAVIDSFSSGIAPGSSSKGDPSIADGESIKCCLNFPENLFKGQLFNSAIIRLHRCPCIGRNGSVELSGVVGVAGLHVVAFTPFSSDFDKDVCLASSSNVTYEETDRLMVEELRIFYKSRKIDFLQSIRRILLPGDRVGSLNFTAAKRAMSSISRINVDDNAADVMNAQNGERSDQNKENDSLFDTSFDAADFDTQARVDNNLPSNSNLNRPNGPLPTQPSSIPHDLQYDDACTRVFHALERIRQQKRITATHLSSIVATPKGRFFDTLCQVVGVLYTTNVVQFNRAFLRVTDGSVPKMEKSLMHLSDCEWDTQKCRVDTRLHDVLRRATVDILCFDEFQEVAATCNPGDIIHVVNFQAQELDSVISLKLNGNGARFKRGIRVLQKANNSNNNVVLRPINITSVRASTSTPTVVIDEDEEEFKFPILESVVGSPINKRPRIDEDSFVAESPRH